MLSIITPTLNSALYIERCICSGLKLKCDYEHIIVDGGSTDGTLEILSKYPHLKVMAEKKTRLGMYSAIHQGFCESSGDLICYLNSDDEMIADGFMDAINYIEVQRADMIYGHGYFRYNEDPSLIKSYSKPFAYFFLKRGFMPFIQPSSIYKRTLYFDVGGFRIEKFKICGDIDFFQRVALAKKYRCARFDGFMSIFHFRDDSLGELNPLLNIIEQGRLLGLKPNFITKVAFKIFGTQIFSR